MRRIRPSLVVAGSVLLVTLLVTATAQARVPGGSKGAAFGAPVKVTPDLGYGYEPAVVADDFGNLFATAHKENWQLVVAPDTDSPTYTRSMSWDWMSADDGQTWKDIPGLTAASLEQHQFGDEGDMAVDDANHLYFVDTYAGDVTVTRWTTSGRDRVSIDFTRPFAPAGEPVDDRPWVTAHGSSTVLYLGNEGDKDTYTSPPREGSGYGPGRYTVYTSHDGGQTFDVLGYTLNDSGWCRPAADHAPGSPYIYVICTNDEGTLYAYVTADDGTTFSRYRIASYNGADSTQSWPTAEVAADGSIWALYVDAGKIDENGDPITNRLRLFHSTDHGRTWKAQDITPKVGRYEYGWLSVAADGRLGLGVYYRPDNASDWRVYGAIWKAGQVPTLVSLDEPHPVQDKHCFEAPGDLMGSAFAPDGHLSVIWTRNTIPSTCGTVTNREIWYARSL
jgi:hypothetical protein